MMDKQKTLIGAAVVILVVLGLVTYWFVQRGGVSLPGLPQSGAPVKTPSEAPSPLPPSLPPTPESTSAPETTPSPEATPTPLP